MVNLLNDRKGFEYSFLLVLVVMVVLSALFLAIYKIGDRHKSSLGEVQASLLNSFYSSESMMVFVDQSAKYSAYRALSELPLQDRGCGRLNNIVLFNKKETPLEFCSFDALENFKILLNNNINGYLSEYSYYEMPVNNYEFLLLNNSVNGIALEPVYIGIYVPPLELRGEILGITVYANRFASYQTGRYFVKPSFSFNINHGLWFYDVIQNYLNKTLIDCALKFHLNQTNEKINCINDSLNDSNVKTRTLDNESFIFEFPQNLQNPFEKDLNIPMAVYIPNI